MSFITVLPVGPEERDLVANLLQLYLHDFSQIEPLETNEEGLFDYQGFEAFWSEPNHHVFLARDENRVVGFAFVQRGFRHEMDNRLDEKLIDNDHMPVVEGCDQAKKEQLYRPLGGGMSLGRES